MSRMTAQRRRAGRVTWFQENEKRAQAVLTSLADPRRRKLTMRDGVPGVDPNVLKAIVEQIMNLPKGALRAGLRPGGPLRLPTAGICTSYKAELFDGIHLAADTYKIALYTNAATIGPSTTAYTATGEVASGGGYTTGGMNLAGRQVVTDTTTAILDWTTDPVWAAATITARGALIYNSSRSNKALAVLDFGGDIASTNGNFTVQLPAPTAAAGAIRIA